MSPLASIAVMWKPNENTLEKRTRCFPGTQLMLRDAPQLTRSSIHPLPSSIKTLPWTKPRLVDGQILVCSCDTENLLPGPFIPGESWSLFRQRLLVWKPWLVLCEAGSGLLMPPFPTTPAGHLWLPCLLLPALECVLSFVNVVGECVFLHYRGQPPASCVISLKFASPSLIYFVCLGVFYCFHPPLAQAVYHFTWWPCIEVYHKHARLIVVTMLSTRAPELTFLITESLYFLTNISPHPTPGNHSSSLCFNEFLRFEISHMRSYCICLSMSGLFDLA